MKRFLLGCTAAIAFAGVTSVQAAEPIKLGIGGYMDQWAGYASNKNGRDFYGQNNYSSFTSTGGNAQKTSQVDEQSDSEIDFKGSTKMDNGIGVAVEVDTSPTQGVNTRTANAQNKDIKRAFATVSGAFGAIELGEQDNVGELIHNSAPDLTGIGGQDNYWMQWVLTPNGHRGTQRTYAGDDRVNDKIIYVSPSFYGLAAGLSYTPNINTSQNGNPSMPSASDAPSAAGNYGVAGNGDLFVYGLAYANKFGNVDVKADVGSGQANIGGLTVYQGGLKVGYAGFTVGGSFIQRNVANSSAVYKDALSQGDAWDAGISYATGPIKVAVNYFSERAAKGNMTDAAAENNSVGTYLSSTSYGHDSDNVVALEGSYDLGPGVAVNLTAFDVKYKDAFGVAAESNQGFGLVSGLAVKF